MKLKTLEALAERHAQTRDIELKLDQKPKIYILDRDRPCIVAGYIESVYRELQEGGVVRIVLLPYVVLGTHIGFFREGRESPFMFDFNPTTLDSCYISREYHAHERTARRFVAKHLSEESLTHRRARYSSNFQRYLLCARRI